MKKDLIGFYKKEDDCCYSDCTYWYKVFEKDNILKFISIHQFSDTDDFMINVESYGSLHIPSDWKKISEKEYKEGIKKFKKQI